VLLVAALPSTEGVLPFVSRIAEFALAGSAAYLVDDASASLTTVSPQGTWRRRAPVLGVGAVLLAGAWAGVLLVLARTSGSASVTVSSAELATLAVGAVAAATVMVRYGDAEPGSRVGPAVLLVGFALLVVGSALHRSLLLPWDETPGAAHVLAWLGAALLALAVTLWASRDPAARGRSGRGPIAGSSGGAWQNENRGS
jgi:hypothetical protein